ncbi:nuclear transport factor 2 family protein [Neolewinella persica]|uniref:nuclear transport factor 2 family protein n=1 Tax=Neolewinella persica TaxID=70998 RepID=UPI0003606B23|nr:nuclear transport factor 2 family protein [Neolewinella persica]
MKCPYIFLLVLFVGVLHAQELEDKFAVVTPVQTQLDAYNTGNLELFLSAYSDTIKIYNFPNELRSSGKESMRKGYGGMFERLQDLQCRLVSRTVMGDKVVDHESVIFSKEDPPSEVIAIYRVEDGLIQEVWFMR